MQRFIRTAALEKSPGVEATLKWLRRRRIRVALLADANQEEVCTILDRLNWRIGENELIQIVIPEQGTQPDPFAQVLELCEPIERRQVLSVSDTPRLLELAARQQIRLNLGVTNGRCAYPELSAAPVHQLLDGIIQLPNYLVGQAEVEA